MAKLEQIVTHKLKPEELKAISEKVAEDSGEERVTTEAIRQYNESHSVNELNVIRKIIRFLFVLHPYLGFMCFLLIPPIILLPIAIQVPSVGIVALGFGVFIGFFIGSFIFPNLVTSCKTCGSIKKSKRIFTHCLEFEDHTEKRYSNGIQYKYLVRDETVFCVYECEKCKSRKIEILRQKKEKRI